MPAAEVAENVTGSAGVAVEEEEPDVAGIAGVDEDAPGDMFPAPIDCNQGTVPTKMLSLGAGCPNSCIKNRTVEAFP